ncbi:hypothetical protein BD780_002605 [Clostridium tetanomorphum]|nr:hypothetical protein [Clostridium tetanomorphum]
MQFLYERLSMYLAKGKYIIEKIREEKEVTVP